MMAALPDWLSSSSTSPSALTPPLLALPLPLLLLSSLAKTIIVAHKKEKSGRRGDGGSAARGSCPSIKNSCHVVVPFLPCPAAVIPNLSPPPPCSLHCRIPHPQFVAGGAKRAKNNNIVWGPIRQRCHRRGRGVSQPVPGPRHMRAQCRIWPAQKRISTSSPPPLPRPSPHPSPLCFLCGNGKLFFLFEGKN